MNQSKSFRPLVLPFVGFALISVWPGANFIANNASEFAWMGGGAVLIIALACAAFWLAGIVFSAAPSLLWPRWSAPRALTIATVAVILLFSQRTTRSWVYDFFSSTHPAVRILYALVVVLLLWLAWRLSRFERFQTVIAVVALVMGISATANVAAAALRVSSNSGEEGSAVPSVNGSVPALAQRNAYYIVLDGYGGGEALQRHFNLDISGFVGEMRDMAFYSADDARSNYVTTHLAMMATLEANYIVDEATPRFGDRRAFFPQGLRLGRQPETVTRVLRGGHDFIYIGNKWAPCSNSVGIQCTAETQDWGFYRNLVATFLSPTELPLGRLGFGSRDQGALVRLAAWVADPSIPKARPYFAFVHELSPHPPYRREGCLPAAAGQSLNQQRTEAGRKGYMRTIECLNQDILHVIRQLIEIDPEALIVLQADHGSDLGVDWEKPLREWSDEAVDERTSILNLIRLPEDCARWLRPTLSPINTMRLTMACLEDREPSFLPERTFLTTYERSPDFGLALDARASLERFRSRFRASSPTGGAE